MANPGVYLLSAPHNGDSTRRDIKELEKILLEEGYGLEEMGLPGNHDIFVKLACGKDGGWVRYLELDTLKKLELMGYRNNTRHYQL